MQTLIQSLESSAPIPAASISQAKILRRHFFRRFFDNDAISIEAETEASVIRALCAVAVPALMVAFWLLPHYPGRESWATAADRYFFVLYSFTVMGFVTTFEWEMLFPDRADFLILLPLPLQERALFLAKAKALLTFLGMFLIAANLFAQILFPAVGTRGNASYAHSAWAHFAAVTLAGICAAFSVLAVEGLALCLIPSTWFRLVSPIIQAISITVLLLLMLLFPICGSHMQPLLEGRASFAQFVPPLWFLGLYEHLQLGASAPAGSAALARLALIATAAVVLVAVFTYPLAWARQKKRALEGALTSLGQGRSLLSTLLHRTLLLRPQARGIFHFLAQTIARNNRYQVYLAMYAGVGLALTLTAVLTFQFSANFLIPALSISGLHAVLPLLLFWLVLGLKAAFGFPVDMKSRWVFPICLLPALRYAGPYPGPDAKTAKTFTLLCCAALTAMVLLLLLELHWSYWRLFIQASFGAILCALLSNFFFVGRTQIPFTRARMPGRSSLPLVLCAYAVLFPVLVLSTVALELWAELGALNLVKIAVSVAVLLVILRVADQLAQKGIIGGFPEDEEDEGPQILGLTQ
jgi:hypothetical protein